MTGNRRRYYHYTFNSRNKKTKCIIRDKSETRYVNTVVDDIEIIMECFNFGDDSVEVRLQKLEDEVIKIQAKIDEIINRPTTTPQMHRPENHKTTNAKPQNISHTRTIESPKLVLWVFLFGPSGFSGSYWEPLNQTGFECKH